MYENSTPNAHTQSGLSIGSCNKWFSLGVGISCPPTAVGGGIHCGDALGIGGPPAAEEFTIMEAAGGRLHNGGLLWGGCLLRPPLTAVESLMMDGKLIPIPNEDVFLNYPN